MPDRSDGIARLSEGERSCLRLLAQGYDIKGLSAALGISVAAANERLRAARAKLGTTSSREAARILIEHAGEHEGGGGPQEIWPRLSGVARQSATAQTGATRRGRLAAHGVTLAMILAALALAGALALTAAEKPLPPEPRVVQTLPAAGAAIAPGPFALTVAYDRPMAPGSWSFVRTGQGAYPACEGRPVQSADGRTFTLRCTAAARTAYAIAFNAGRFRNFRSVAGVAAQPYLLRFRAR